MGRRNFRLNERGEPYLAEIVLVSGETDVEEWYGRISGSVVLYGRDPVTGYWEWQSLRNWDVWRFDLVGRERTPVATDPGLNEFVFGFDENLVALAHMPAYGVRASELYLYDLASGQRSPLIARVTGADVSQGILVYCDVDNGSMVFGYDTQTGERFQISSEGTPAWGHVFGPSISGEWVVWAYGGNPFALPLYANRIRPSQPVLRVASSPSCSAARATVTLRSPCPAEGFSFGLAHAPGMLTPVRIDYGRAVAALRGGRGPQFWAATLGAAGDGRVGITVGMIGSKENPAGTVLPANEDLEIAVITYRAPGAAFGPVESSLEFVDVLRPQPDTEATRCVVTCGGQSKLPRKEPGVLRVEGVCFARGNCNCDDNLIPDISDPIYLLGYLFLGGDFAPCCERACDADDSGVLEITDAIVILNRLFLGAPPLPAPYRECGLDPTPDTLGCSEFPPCER